MIDNAWLFRFDVRGSHGDDGDVVRAASCVGQIYQALKGVGQRPFADGFSYFVVLYQVCEAIATQDDDVAGSQVALEQVGLNGGCVT
jgi:hypothetical protein